MSDAREPVPHARRLVATWAALLALLLASAGSAWLRLGPFNLVASLVIAALKAGLVLLVFMRVREAPAMARIAMAAAVLACGLLAGLASFDVGTRAVDPAAVQPPQVLPPLRAERPAR